MKSLLPVILLSILVASCSDGDSVNRALVASNSPEENDNNNENEPTGEGIVDNSGDVAALSVVELTNASLSIKTETDSFCTNFSVEAKDEAGSSVASAKITFAIVSTGSGESLGNLSPATARTDADGKASTTYCSGTTAHSLFVSAASNGVSINSDEISVAGSITYDFTFLSSTPEPTKIIVGEDQETTIRLNLLDSGPTDCGTLNYKLENSGSPVVGQEVTFTTQYDPPRSLKLALKSVDGTFESPVGQSKKRATYTTVSSDEGILSVPICAGVALGTVVVTGEISDDDGASIIASSPVIAVTGGLTNYANMSLTFDSSNARTLKGYFNTNSNHTVDVKIRANTTGDGDAIEDHPIFLASETGRVQLKNGGLIDETGHAEFSMEALHMIDNYAHRVLAFEANPEARSRCNPIDIASSLGGNPAGLSYTDLSQNWRSTVAYAVRGQEFFYDANGNGKYDGGGDGFWDKNLNGVFDSGDVLTYDANNNASFDYIGEWFIDQPSPFVDANEDGIYTETIDILIGDVYEAPNGMRDVDSNIWKHEVFPIYMGMSNYALIRNRVQPTYTDLDETIATLPAVGKLLYNDIDDDEFWGVAAPDTTRRSSAEVTRYIFAHGICGNPLPGGSKMGISFEEITSPGFGPRIPVGSFNASPGDEIREASRHFVVADSVTTSPSEAKINFNAPDHPMKEYGYPVSFDIRVPQCSNACTGAVVSPANPVACDAAQYRAMIHISEPEETGGGTNTVSALIDISAVRDCVCATGAGYLNGICTCPEGTEFDQVDSCDPA